jgi:flagellar biosynthetic protein FliR
MLRDILATNVFQFLMVFARVGAAMMLFPGFGSAMVSVRLRLLLALAVAFVIFPVVGGSLPAMPPDPLSIALLAAGEATIGVFLGMISQMLMAALDLAGNFIGYAVGLTNALAVDPTTAQQSQLVSGFLTMAAITVILASDTHHLMLRALADSYGLFQPGQPLPVDDFSAVAVRTIGESFALAFQLAAPAVVFSLVFNTGLGLLNRLVPQMQVFFVGLPIQVLVGLSVVMVALPALMMWFMRHFRDGLSVFLAPG